MVVLVLNLLQTTPRPRSRSVSDSSGRVTRTHRDVKSEVRRPPPAGRDSAL